MITNTHIVTLRKQLDEAIELIQRLPQSVEKECLGTLIEEMGLQLICVDLDMEKIIKRAGELAAENYGAMVYALASAEHYFCRITPACFQRHMADHVERHLHKACGGKARALWETIHGFELMGFLNTQNLSAAELYRDLTEHFGRLPFTERAFRSNR